MKTTPLPTLLLAGLLCGSLAPAQAQTTLRKTASGNTCEFGEPDYAASCANTNGTHSYLGANGYGAYGEHAFGSFGYLGSATYGAYGRYVTGYVGILGSAFYGAYGSSAAGNYGFLGGSIRAVYGENVNLNYGYLGGGDYGAFGRQNGTAGPFGYLGGGDYGAYGEHNTGNYGYLGGNSYGAYGQNNNDNLGYLGHQSYGAVGVYNTGHYGILGGSIYGAHGRNANNNRGYLGHDDFGVWGTGSPWAGYFAGNVHVTGTLTQGSAASKVDHPLDPAGRYLSHSFVESPEMKTVYDGTVTTDTEGFATVTLPDYFEALNRDFRYQLTVIGQFARAVVAEKIQGNRFVIRTDEPNVEVSWQVTGIRQDPWANEHRLVVEQTKPPEEQGRYLHPRLYGQAEAQRIGWIEDDAASVDSEAVQQQIDEEQRQIDQERQRMDAERQRMQAEHERLQRPTPPDNRP